MGTILVDEISKFRLPESLVFIPAKLKPQKRKGWDTSGTEHFPDGNHSQSSIPSAIPVRTVHGVKGETHEVTIFVCPPTAEKACPSAVWLSGEEKDREEKIIAYVAITRSRDLLIMWVPEDTAKRLHTKQPLFVGSFECMTTDEFVASCIPRTL